MQPISTTYQSAVHAAGHWGSRPTAPQEPGGFKGYMACQGTVHMAWLVTGAQGLGGHSCIQPGESLVHMAWQIPCLYGLTGPGEH